MHFSRGDAPFSGGDVLHISFSHIQALDCISLFASASVAAPHMALTELQLGTFAVNLPKYTK